MSAYDIPDEALDAADRIYGGQIPFSGLRQILDAALPFILPGEIADAEKRGAVKALRQLAEQYDDERVAELTVRGNVAMAARDLAHLIKSGEVTLP